MTVCCRVDNLFLTGRYHMEAVSSTWLMSNITSEGDRDMEITLKDVILGVEVGVELTETGAVVTEIFFPLEYSKIQFEFDNIGDVIGTVLDVIGDVIVEAQRQKLVTIVKSYIEAEVPSLVTAQNYTFIPNKDPIPSYDSFFKYVLRREGSSKDLVRDRYEQ